MPKKHVEQGLLQLRKLASEQEPRQLVEPSRSDQATGGASMATLRGLPGRFLRARVRQTTTTTDEPRVVACARIDLFRYRIA